MTTIPRSSAEPPARRARILAALTCFNRKALTLGSLRALARAAEQAGVDLEAVLVDDASPDGTAAAVRAEFPWVEVVDGSGSLFWNRGMHEAFGRAMARRTADYYLWLNDDTEIVPDALARLVDQSRTLRARLGHPVIVVGATAERGSGRITYGGRVAGNRLRRFTYRLVSSDSEPLLIDAVEGNCVLIDKDVAHAVGNLDPTFEHAMGDTDYGLRARKAGFPSYLAPGVMGYCRDNPVAGSFADDSLTLKQRWKVLVSRKGLPPQSWMHFTRRHGGWLWPLYFAWPYVRVVTTSLAKPRAGHR